MTLRDLVYDTGGRRFVFALYVVTMVMATFAVLRWRNLIPPEAWDVTIGATWKIAAAYLGAHALEDVAVAVGKGAGGTAAAPKKLTPGGNP